jgi:hypothetical protein
LGDIDTDRIWPTTSSCGTATFSRAMSVIQPTMIGMANRRIHFAKPVRGVGLVGVTGSMVGALTRSSSDRTSAFADVAPVLTARLGHLGEAPPCDVRSGFVIVDSDAARRRRSAQTTRGGHAHRMSQGTRSHLQRHRAVIGHRQLTVNQNFRAAGGRHVGLASIGNGCYRRRRRLAAAQH